MLVKGMANTRAKTDMQKLLLRVCVWHNKVSLSNFCNFEIFFKNIHIFKTSNAIEDDTFIEIFIINPKLSLLHIHYFK